jgi:uncharacterized protein (DUF2235 family)
MADQPATEATQRKKRNIVIFSDGTGQRGGQFFDEDRTNIYKLFRATRVGPDSPIDPDEQVAFYDPGLGTQRAGGELITQAWRWFYNFLSQATGLGITQNIIDCYAAIIRLWQPGDRIFLFGFSRGAYTIRCLASIICLCGVPTTGMRGAKLKLDPKSTQKIASRAVKTVYQHVSSPRDMKFHAQRETLAALFRADYSSADTQKPKEPNVYPFFIGVLDTVASLSNLGSLGILLGIYVALLCVASSALAIFSFDFWYWVGWLLVDTICVLGGLYVYTHLKFSFRLPNWWETVHLTTFRQKFYDQNLDENVNYARHAISIDERRADFTRVRWGSAQSEWKTGIHKIAPMKQWWFAGNHTDIGGGYPENESRLSDIALKWMIDEARHEKLGDEKLIVNDDVLHLHPCHDGMQHDETRGSFFRFAGKVDRDPVVDATLHPSVVERFALDEVQQYDIKARYRPESLRHHQEVAHYYQDVPTPHMTCWQRIKAALKDRNKSGT